MHPEVHKVAGSKHRFSEGSDVKAATEIAGSTYQVYFSYAPPAFLMTTISFGHCSGHNLQKQGNKLASPLFLLPRCLGHLIFQNQIVVALGPHPGRKKPQSGFLIPK